MRVFLSVAQQKPEAFVSALQRSRNFAYITGSNALRHAKVQTTLDLYTQGDNDNKITAQDRFCGLIVDQQAGTVSAKTIQKNGGDDGTRTRGLCRDSEKLTSIFNDFESTDGNASHRKCVVSEAIVYHDVYHKSIMCSAFGS